MTWLPPYVAKCVTCVTCVFPVTRSPVTQVTQVTHFKKIHTCWLYFAACLLFFFSIWPESAAAGADRLKMRLPSRREGLQASWRASWSICAQAHQMRPLKSLFGKVRQVAREEMPNV
jgi:hypothetical protein